MATTPGKRPEALATFLERGIQERIAQGTYAQGARLSPTALAKDFGVSHIPLREALSSLAAKGYIEYQQSKGYFTRKLTSGELADIYRWRALLESEAVTLSLPNLTEQDLIRMEELIAVMGRKTKPADRMEYLELNRQFHFTLFERAGSPVLLHLLNYLWDVSHPYFAMTLSAGSAGHLHHLEQLNHAKAGDLKALLRALDDHRGSRYRLIREWESESVPTM